MRIEQKHDKITQLYWPLYYKKEVLGEFYKVGLGFSWPHPGYRKEGERETRDRKKLCQD